MNLVKKVLDQDCASRKVFLNLVNQNAPLQDQRIALARIIDSTKLSFGTAWSDVESLIAEAKRWQTRAICIPSCFVSEARHHLGDSTVKLATVAGFPFGYSTLSQKVIEVEEACANGADEIDFVQNVGWVLEGKWQKVCDEYKSISSVSKDVVTKVILETSLLQTDQIVKCVEIAQESNISMIKTSTGFGIKGASIQDIELIASAIKNSHRKQEPIMGIKASGGISDFYKASSLIAAGATRIGTSQIKSVLGLEK